jgi:hypothetical protein
MIIARPDPGKFGWHKDLEFLSHPLERNRVKAKGYFKGQNEILSMDSLLASEPQTKEAVRKGEKRIRGLH